MDADRGELVGGEEELFVLDQPPQQLQLLLLALRQVPRINAHNIKDLRLMVDELNSSINSNRSQRYRSLEISLDGSGA